MRATYDERPREAGVYLLRNSITGKILVSSSPDLASIRNRLDFGRSTNSTGVLDRRLVADAKAFGIASFELEIIDVLDTDPARDDAQTNADLVALQALWREKLSETPQY